MQKYNYRNIRKEMQENKWHQGYLFYGEEKYLIRQLIDLVVNRFISVEMRDVDLIRLKIERELSDGDLQRIKQELQTPAFLSEKKIIIVENSGLFSKADKGKSDQLKRQSEEFLESLDFLNPHSCLIFVEDSVDGRKKSLLNQLSNADMVQVELAKEEFDTLRQWINAKTKKEALKITGEAADALIARCESSMEDIEQELYKVILYAQYSELEGINLQMINLVCRPDIQGNIFQLTESIARGDAKEALRLLDILLMNKEPLPLIRFMFNRHIKQLICAKDLQNQQALIKEAKIHPYAAKKLINQMKFLNMEDLEYLYRQCFESDWQVKRGHMGDRLSFESLLIKSSLTFSGKD